MDVDHENGIELIFKVSADRCQFGSSLVVNKRRSDASYPLLPAAKREERGERRVHQVHVLAPVLGSLTVLSIYAASVSQGQIMHDCDIQLVTNLKR